MARAKRFARTSTGDAKTPQRRRLINEILIAQIGYALIVGAVALGSVWSATQWIVQDNIDEWTDQWMTELKSLGEGLYDEQNDERFIRIERYISKFPEISYIRYYDDIGQLTFQDAGNADRSLPPLLRTSELQDMSIAALSDPPQLNPVLQEQITDWVMRISAPLTTTRINAVDLSNAASLEDLPTVNEVIGFVELGLDYRHYDDRLAQHTANAAAGVACAFLVLALLGRILLRRALQPLQDIQAPLAKLAEGDTDIVIGTSPHAEIAAIANGVANAATRISERDQHLNYLANHDSLTGLPNRHSFMNLLDKERHDGVMFVDLDQFKYVNDTLGHIAGDAILKQVAQRLKSCVGDAGVIARFGGDEFCVLIKGADIDCTAIAHRIMAGLVDYPFVINNQSFTLSCSIGLLLHDDALNQKSDDIVAQAGIACQKAKTDGRNRVRVYEPEADAIAALRTDINWSQTLKYALKHNQFVLFYQPIVGVADGSTSHFEVLLRLRSESGLHAPGAFLGAAQRFGLMKDIDRWVIEHAFRSLAWYRRQDPELRFTINVSGGAFADGDLPDFISELLTLNKLDPGAVIFEITEQIAIGSFADATSQILNIMEFGCEFALDDFGAGYSAFNYLKELPMQYVKIDGQFIRELHTSKTDQLIVRAIADICKTIGKKTIAEFVEHEQTLELLKEFGIDYAQGYLLGKPDEKLKSSQRFYLDTLETDGPDETGRA